MAERELPLCPTLAGYVPPEVREAQSTPEPAQSETRIRSRYYCGVCGEPGHNARRHRA